jgi:hypothetical protein
VRPEVRASFFDGSRDPGSACGCRSGTGADDHGAAAGFCERARGIRHWSCDIG